MTRQEIRLELIKIAHAHGRESEEAVKRAKVYEDYILEKEPSFFQETILDKKVEAKKFLGKSKAHATGELDNIL